jgi:hypothetical protein
MRVSTGLPDTSVQGSIWAGRPPGSATREAPGPETRISVSVTGRAAALLITKGMETTGSPETTLMAPGSPAVAPSETRTSTNPAATGADGRVSRKCIPAPPSRTPTATATATAVENRLRPVEPPEIVSARTPLPDIDDQPMDSLSAPGTTSRRYASHSQERCQSVCYRHIARSLMGAHIGGRSRAGVGVRHAGPVESADHPLAEEAQAVLPRGWRFLVKVDDGGWVVDIARDDGTVVWPDFAGGPDPLRAVLEGEQRYLVEEVGSGSVPGRTYLAKANERLRRYHADHA